MRRIKKMSCSDYKSLHEGYLDNTGYNTRNIQYREKYSNNVEKFTMFTDDHQLYPINSQIKVLAKYTENNTDKYILIDGTIKSYNNNNSEKFQVYINGQPYSSNTDYSIFYRNYNRVVFDSPNYNDRIYNVPYNHMFSSHNGYYFALETVGTVRDPRTGAIWPTKQYKNVPDNDTLIQKLNSGMSECETLKIYVSNSYINPYTELNRVINGTYYVNDPPAIIPAPANITFRGQTYPLINGKYIEYRKNKRVNCTGAYSSPIIKINPASNIGYYEQTFNISQNKSCGGEDCPPSIITSNIPDSECCEIQQDGKTYDPIKKEIIQTKNVLKFPAKCGSRFLCEDKTTYRVPTITDCPGTYKNIQTSLSDCKIVGTSKKGVAPKKQGTKTTVEKSYLGDTLCAPITYKNDKQSCPSTA